MQISVRKLSEIGTLTLYTAANCIKHTVFNNEFIICHPGFHDAVPFQYIKATQNQAPKVRHKCLLGYHQPKFSWGRFYIGGTSGSTWKKDLSSSAVEGLAMNSFQTSTSCIFQVCYKLHQQNMSDGSAPCTDLQSTWQRP